MGRAFGVFWSAVVDVYNELFPMVGMNVLWLILSLPAYLLAGGLVGLGVMGGAPDEAGLQLAWLLALIPVMLGPNPAAAGIHLYANQLIKEERVEFGLFWQGLRQYVWRSSLLYLLGLVGYVLLVTNVRFYLLQPPPFQFIGFLFLYALYFWFSMQFFMLPLLVEQHDKRLRLVLRNAALLALTNIPFTLVVLLLALVVIVLSVVLGLVPLVLFTGSLTAVMANRALHVLLERYRPQPEKTAAAD